MPRYYFNIKSEEGIVEDLEGVELRGEREARDEAVDAAREILSEKVRKGELGLPASRETKTSDRKGWHWHHE